MECVGEEPMTAGDISFAFRADGTGCWRYHESKFMEGSQMMELIYIDVALGKLVVTNRETF